MTSPRAVIVGAGLMGRWHAHACRKAGGRVVAVVEIDCDAGERFAQQFARGAVVATSLEQVPASVPFDVVHVCSPAQTHADIVRAVIARRVPAIVEKPLAVDAAVTERLLDEAARAGIWIQPVHQTIFQPGVQRALAWARQQALVAFDYRACSAGSEASGKHDEVVADILSHPLALLDALVSDSTSGSAPASCAWHVTRPRAGELVACASARTMAVRLLISMHARPTRHDLTLLADGGTMTIDLFHGFASLEGPRAPTRAWKVAQPFAAAAGTALNASRQLARRALAGELAYPGLNELVLRAYRAIGHVDRRPLADRHVLAVARNRDEILVASRRG